MTTRRQATWTFLDVLLVVLIAFYAVAFVQDVVRWARPAPPASSDIVAEYERLLIFQRARDRWALERARLMDALEARRASEPKRHNSRPPEAYRDPDLAYRRMLLREGVFPVIRHEAAP